MEYIDFDTAKKLRYNGFPQHWSNMAYIVGYGEEEEEFEVGGKYPIEFIPEHIPIVSAPTIAQVLRWLREKKKIFVEIALSPEGYRNIIYTGVYCMKTPAAHHFTFDGFFNLEDSNYITYELAALAGIKYALDLIEDDAQKHLEDFLSPFKEVVKHHDKLTERANRITNTNHGD